MDIAWYDIIDRLADRIDRALTKGKSADAMMHLMDLLDIETGAYFWDKAYGQKQSIQSPAYMRQLVPSIL